MALTDLSQSPIDSFKKSAKALLTEVQSGDPMACDRLRRVIHDFTGKGDGEIAAEVKLAQAQHVCAVDHGFENWNKLLTASPAEVRLALTMARLPSLNDSGIGTDHARGSREERTARGEEWRRQLRALLAEIYDLAHWLQTNIEPTEAADRWATSYGLKHIIEVNYGYVSNGMFIAAAVIAGYPYQLIPDSPNVWFGMSKASFKLIQMQRNKPGAVYREYAKRAIKVLEERGFHARFASRSEPMVVWSEDGGIRTFHFGGVSGHDVSQRPFIVRLSLDHYTPSLLSKNMLRQLGLRTDKNWVVHRPGSEVTVLPHEFEAALRWMLSHDARAGNPMVAFPFKRTGFEAWRYIWSEGASDAAAKKRSAA